MSSIWINGELVDSTEASISPLDHGFTVADGVFETMKVVDNEVFALERHLARLQKSVLGLGLNEVNLALIEKAVTETLSANAPLDNGRLRITVTSGAGPLGSNRGDNPETIVVVTSPVTRWPATTSIAVVPWRRNERSAVVGLKTTSYAENVVALEAAHDAGCSEAIFLDTRDFVSEGTGTNIFFIVDGTLCTPSESCGILNGITRELAIELAQTLNVNVAVGEYRLSDLVHADEIFLTSSTRDIHPVTEVKVLNSQLEVTEFISLGIGTLTEKLQVTWASTFDHNMHP
jgi:branched-chain amino acid aminotransferase